MTSTLSHQLCKIIDKIFSNMSSNWITDTVYQDLEKHSPSFTQTPSFSSCTKWNYPLDLTNVFRQHLQNLVHNSKNIPEFWAGYCPILSKNHRLINFNVMCACDTVTVAISYSPILAGKLFQFQRGTSPNSIWRRTQKSTRSSLLQKRSVYSPRNYPLE